MDIKTIFMVATRLHGGLSSMQAICKKCGCPFETSNPRKLYCSQKCKTAMRVRIAKQEHVWKQQYCVECGKALPPKSRKGFCSDVCKKQHKSRMNTTYMRTYRHKHLKLPGMLKECRVCRKMFTPNSGRQVACSMECQRVNHLNNIRSWTTRQRVKHQQECAQAMQTTPVKSTGMPYIKQDFRDSLGIERLSALGCRCLRCGKEFNLLITNGRNAYKYLKKRETMGKSPCPYCGEAPTGYKCGNKSTSELELQQLYPNFTVRNYRPEWMEGGEIDLYDPVAKVGLEFHGIRWHSTAVLSNYEASKKHEHKAGLCERNGVQLIQLYETEWEQRRDCVVDKLDAIFHKDMKRVFARKLQVVLLNSRADRSKVTQFMDENHIQGAALCQWAVGLHDGQEFVAVCTFKYGTGYSAGGQAANTQKYWELNRYATKLGYSVVGGLSKCIKAFSREHPDVHSIISFADRRWTSSVRSAYSSSGFVEVARQVPNYMYTDLRVNHPLRNKQYMRKSQIKARGEACYSPDKTETEMSRELGYYRIYDAGKIKYMMEL